MNKTPSGSRRHVAILGNVNAGKSSLFNAILGQNTSIVSDERGTTTDPVLKAMELVPYGPIVLIDTGGLDDLSSIGKKRVERTKNIMKRTDFALYAWDINSFDEEEYIRGIQELSKEKIPHILVFTKVDVAKKDLRDRLEDRFKRAVFVSDRDIESIDNLKNTLVESLDKLNDEEEAIIGTLLPRGSTVVMVVTIDAGAPKGRLILPQVQFIRDCLDHDIKCLVTKEDQLESLLKDINEVQLVVTDSQNFKSVDKIVPRKIPLTSFSMLLAKQKGDMDVFMRGVNRIDDLKDGSKILMLEVCSHTTSHDDIGRIKIPNMLKKHTGKNLVFDFHDGKDFPENLRDYDLAIHCGGCMINKRAVQNRLDACEMEGLPIINYGVILAYLTGILDRCKELFEI